MGGALQERRPAPRRRPLIAERLAGFVYGTIVVLAVLVAGVRAYPDDAGRIAVLVLVTSFVSSRTPMRTRSPTAWLTTSACPRQSLRLIARREGSLVEAAVPPLAALMLGAFDAVSTSTAVWIAFESGSSWCSLLRASCSAGRAAALAGDASGRRGERRPRSRPGGPQAVRDPPIKAARADRKVPQAAPIPCSTRPATSPANDPEARRRASRRRSQRPTLLHRGRDRHDHELLEPEVEGTHRQHAGHQAPAGHGRSPGLGADRRGRSPAPTSYCMAPPILPQPPGPPQGSAPRVHDLHAMATIFERESRVRDQAACEDDPPTVPTAQQRARSHSETARPPRVDRGDVRAR